MKIQDYDLSKTLIQGMHGLGDNITQRAFFKELDQECFLATPWPEIYADLPHVKVVKCETKLRTQIRNIGRQDETIWHEAPNPRQEFRLFYGVRDLETGSIQKTLSHLFGEMKPKTFDLPAFEPELFEDLRPLAVLRPATLRKEWLAGSRNAHPQYLFEAAELLRARGYYVVSVCDLEEGLEWIEGEVPIVDRQYHKGELNAHSLLSLVRAADVLVGGHGWLTHAAIAMNKPMMVVAGGYGGHNSPGQVADPHFVDNSMLTWIFPDQYCRCTQMNHNCNKEIKNFKGKALQWMENLATTKPISTT